MKYATSAMMLLLASTLATANEPQQQAAEQSLVLAYNTDTAIPATATAIAPNISHARSERALNETLGEVSANLSVELDQRIASELPTFAK